MSQNVLRTRVCNTLTLFLPHFHKVLKGFYVLYTHSISVYSIALELNDELSQEILVKTYVIEFIVIIRGNHCFSRRMFYSFCL